MKLRIVLLLIGGALLVVSAASAIDSLGVHLKEGGRAFTNNNYPLAIEHFNAALEIDSNNVLALQSLGVIYSDVNNYQQAIQYLDRALALDSTNASTYNSRGIALLGLADTTGALEMHRLAVKLAPEKTRFAVNLGNLLFGMHRLSELLSAMKNVLAYDTTDAQVYYLIGRGLLAADQQYQCVDFFDKAHKLKPNNLQYEYYLAVANHETGNVVEAETGLKEILRKSPDHFDARMRLGVMSILADRNKEAREQFEEAVRINPDSEEAKVALGSVYLRLGMTEEADEIHAWLEKRNPGAAEKMRRLGKGR
ncbi:MAG: tetratricopeptide repeat protein [candidate division Zixibacteria bacterium]|nr:tetratricopeptide repeat protein [candidate division Zixibacteria bacterium]